MDLTLTTKYLQEAASSIESTLTGKTQLSDVQLTARNGTLEVLAVSNELDVCCQIPATVDQEGQLTVPGQAFVLLASSMPGELTRLCTHEHVLRLTSLHTISDLTLSNQAFMQVDFPAQNHGFPVPLKHLKKAIGRTKYATSKDTGQTAGLDAIKLEFRQNRIRVVSCDGYRLSLDEFQATTPEVQDLLISHRAAEKITSLLKDDEVQVSASEQVLSIKGKQVLINVRLMGKPYPDYERVIPMGFMEEVMVEAEALKKGVERVTLLSSSKDCHRLETQLNGQKMTLVCVTEYGRNVESLPINRKTETPLVLTLNGRFLSDSLKALSGEVTLSISSPEKPLLVRGQDEGYRNVITPLRTSS